MSPMQFKAAAQKSATKSEAICSTDLAHLSKQQFQEAVLYLFQVTMLFSFCFNIQPLFASQTLLKHC